MCDCLRFENPFCLTLRGFIIADYLDVGFTLFILQYGSATKTYCVWQCACTQHPEQNMCTLTCRAKAYVLYAAYSFKILRP